MFLCEHGIRLGIIYFVLKLWRMHLFRQLMIYELNANIEKATRSQTVFWCNLLIRFYTNQFVDNWNFVLRTYSWFLKLRLHAAYNCISTNLLVCSAISERKTDIIFSCLNSVCWWFVKIPSPLHKFYSW